MQSATDKKKVKQIFKIKKGYLTCSNLLINELVRSPTRSENVYLANNEQPSIAVFTAVFCFTHVEHHLIKLKLYNNKFKETNQISSPLKISQSINAESSCDRNNKSVYSCFHESKKILSCLM